MASSHRPQSPGPAEASNDNEWIRSWIDDELLAFLQAHYDISIAGIDSMVNDVAPLMEDFEDPGYEENFEASVVHAAINRRTMGLGGTIFERVQNYVWVAAVLVDWRERHHEAKIADLQRLGKTLSEGKGTGQ